MTETDYEIEFEEETELILKGGGAVVIRSHLIYFTDPELPEEIIILYDPNQGINDIQDTDLLIDDEKVFVMELINGTN